MFHSKQDVDHHVSEVFRNIKSENERNLKCYQIAKLYFKIKDYRSAIKYINRYILTTSNSAPAHRLLGECYLGINLKVKALNAFKTSLELNGSQHDLVLKICTLLMDPEIFGATPRATYWLDRAESLFPTNPVVFQLKEHILKSNLEGKQDNAQLDKLLLSEIKARPTDVTVRIRFLNFFLETKRYKLAYQQALELEDRQLFSNDQRWYDCLCNVFQAYEKANGDVGFNFFIKKLYFLERRVDLFMQEFHDDVKTLPECSAALYAFDQSLHLVSKIDVPHEETHFFKECIRHLRAQLSFHLATLALKRAKKEYGLWPKTFRTVTPLLLQASQSTMDLEDAWYGMWVGKNKMMKEVQVWNKAAALRVSQAGHVLISWSENKGAKFLEKVSQFCRGKWQNVAYQDIFYSKDHLQGMSTSHFVNDSSFSFVPMRLLTEGELKQFDDVAQTAYPDSLHHLVWLGLAYCNANGQLSHDFRCKTVPDLQFTVDNLTQTGPESLTQLDVDAFLYASVLCGKMATSSVITSDRPSRLPVSIAEELCTPAQADWWVAVYKSYKNESTGNISEMRLKLRKGIETIRALGQHGLHVKLIVHLAKLFQERAAGGKTPSETAALEERAYLYWSAAIPMLERVDKNQQTFKVFPNRLFDYRVDKLSPTEIKDYLMDGKLFLGCRLMKKEQHEEAIEIFQTLKSPYAVFYQGLIYEKLAYEEVNHRPDSITSENRSQHLILLTRARDAFYLTLDRLRCPSVDPNHPLNTQLQDHLEAVEKQLAMIEPDNSVAHRNGDTECEDPDAGLRPLSPDPEDVAEHNISIYNSSNFLNVKNQGTPKSVRQKISDKHALRLEARPSPERLDAQLRHLVNANSNGLQAIVEQLKEIKSIMQIEFKDLGCVTRDLLAEMKKWGDKLESLSRRGVDTIKTEDLFNLGEEDYDDLSQLSQSYTPYQNYLVNRQLAGGQANSTVSYGTQSPVPSGMPGTENQMLPPSFYPTPQSVPQIDPVLLYQSLGYYQGLPYNDALNASDYRPPGVQKELRKKKGVHFPKNVPRAPDAVVPPVYPPGTVPPVTTAAGGLTPPKQPPNVVITSSDTLPAFTTVGTPALSVTIPPQHIRCTTPSTVQKLPTTQAHPFQIQMPPQAQLVNESPTEKLNSMIPTTQPGSVVSPKTTIQGAVSTVADKTNSPTLSQTMGGGAFPRGPVVNLTGAQDKSVVKNQSPKVKTEVKGKKLFESPGKLFVFDRMGSRDVGSGCVKIVNDEESQKMKLVVVPDQSQVPSVYYITTNTVLEPVGDGKWSVGNFLRADGTDTSQSDFWPKFSVQFKTEDEGKNFKQAFTDAYKVLNKFNDSLLKKSSLSTAFGKAGDAEKKPSEKATPSPQPSQTKDKPNEKTNLGGFTFVSSPLVQPPVAKKPEEVEKPKETPKPSPFAAFSFSASSPAATGANTNTSQSANNSVNLFGSVKADPNSFKKDKDFKVFEGHNSLVFGNLNKPKTASPAATATTATATRGDQNAADEDEGDDGEFVPTAEFKPVIDLPDLVDVKTGEEDDQVLFKERVKLLRFDTGLKEWKERGVGEMKVLLNEESGKVRLIMRRELVFKVCCNHYLTESMEFKPLTKSDKALSWYAQDYSEGVTKDELFALKFKNPEMMSKFLKVISDTQAKMKGGEIRSKEGDKGKEDKSKNAVPLSELFKPKAGSWECGACMTRNDESNLKCVCCETAKPGTEPETKADSPGQSKLLGKGITFPPATTTFTFGIPQQPTSTPAGAAPSAAATVSTASPAQPFTFGIPQNATGVTATTNTVSPGSIFGAAKTTTTASVSPASIFGAAKTTTAATVSPASIFGAAKTTVTTAASVSPASIFGASASSTTSTAPSPGSIFGLPKPSTAVTSSTVTPSNMFTFGKSAETAAAPKATINFGEPASSTGTTTFPWKSTFGVTSTAAGTGQTTSTTANTAPLFSSSGTPATSFRAVFNTTPTTSSPNIFGGTPLKKPDEQSGESGGGGGGLFSFNVSKPNQDKSQSANDTPKTSFSFLSGVKLNEKEKFEFSLKPPSKADLEKSISPKGKPSGDGVTSEDSDGEPEEDNGDHLVFNPVVPLPEKVALHTGEEDEDLKYEQRAKLYRFSNKEWKERGIGDVKILKHKTNHKIRLLMRREVVLKVCMNHYVTPDIDFTLKEDKTWIWTAPDFAEGEVVNELFALRFKTAEIAAEFMKALKNVRSGCDGDSSSPGKPELPPTMTFAPSTGVASTETVTSTKGSSDDDISVVYEYKVTPEQQEKAENLQLPRNFYSYLQAPDCPGCPGCDKDDTPVSSVASPQSSSTTVSTSSVPTTSTSSIFGNAVGNKLWSSTPINFDSWKLKGDAGKFSFSGNTGVTTAKPFMFNLGQSTDKTIKKTEDEDEEEEDDDDDDGGETEEHEDDDDDDDEDEDDDGEDGEYEDYGECEDQEEEEETCEDEEEYDEDEDNDGDEDEEKTETAGND